MHLDAEQRQPLALAGDQAPEAALADRRVRARAARGGRRRRDLRRPVVGKGVETPLIKVSEAVPRVHGIRFLLYLLKLVMIPTCCAWEPGIWAAGWVEALAGMGGI